MKQQVELLAPAGSFDSLKASVNAGCDSIYLGYTSFGARGFADNFTLDEMERAIDYCHVRGVKSYVTFNTIYKEKELQQVCKCLESIIRMGADAVIIQDMGLAQIIKDNQYPISMHASTQLSASGPAYVNWLKEQNFSRVVLARELSIFEIESICSQTNMEIEIFAHGALCFSYSGQCHLSFACGGRSGNRGVCAQPCRLSYELRDKQKRMKSERYFLSPKDLCTLEILPKLVNSKIHCLKIEGRMKSPLYAASTVRIYKEALLQIEEGVYDIKKEKIAELSQVFNRGFSLGSLDKVSSSVMAYDNSKHTGVFVGYCHRKKDSEYELFPTLALDAQDYLEVQGNVFHYHTVNYATSTKDCVKFLLSGEKKDALPVFRIVSSKLNKELKTYVESDMKKVELFVQGTFKKNEPAILSVTDGKQSLTVKGPVVEAANNKPLKRFQIEKQINKTGNTPYIYKEQFLDMDSDIFIPVNRLNALRRETLDEFSKKVCSAYKKNVNLKLIADHVVNEKKRGKITVYVRKKEQLFALEGHEIDRLYVDVDCNFIQEAKAFCMRSNTSFWLSLHPFDKNCSYDKKKLSFADGLLLRNPAQISLAKQMNFPMIADWNFNIRNKKAMEFFKGLGFLQMAIDVEANEKEWNAFSSGEIWAYGRKTLMYSHFCPIPEVKSGRFCQKKEKASGYELRNNKGMIFPIIPHCEQCYIELIDQKAHLSFHPHHRHFDHRLSFFEEDEKQIKDVLHAIQSLFYVASR